MKKLLYSSLTVIIAGMILLAGMVAWFYIGKILWSIIQAVLG